MTTTKPIQNAFTMVRPQGDGSITKPPRALKPGQYYDARGRVVRGPGEYGRSKLRENSDYRISPENKTEGEAAVNDRFKRTSRASI